MKQFDSLYKLVSESLDKPSRRRLIKESRKINKHRLIKEDTVDYDGDEEDGQSFFKSDEEIYAAIDQLDLNDAAAFEKFLENVADYISHNTWDTEIPRCLGLSNWENIKTDIRYRKSMVKYLKHEIGGQTVTDAITYFLTKPGNLDKIKDWIIEDSKKKYSYLYDDWKIKEDGTLIIMDEDLYNIVFMMLDESKNVADFESEETMIDCKVLFDAEGDAGQWGDSMLGFPIRGGDDWYEQEDFDAFLDSMDQVEYYKYNDEENWPSFANESVKVNPKRRLIKEGKTPRRSFKCRRLIKEHRACRPSRRRIIKEERMSSERREELYKLALDLFENYEWSSDEAQEAFQEDYPSFRRDFIDDYSNSSISDEEFTKDFTGTMAYYNSNQYLEESKKVDKRRRLIKEHKAHRPSRRRIIKESVFNPTDQQLHNAVQKAWNGHASPMGWNQKVEKRVKSILENSNTPFSSETEFMYVAGWLAKQESDKMAEEG